MNTETKKRLARALLCLMLPALVIPACGAVPEGDAPGTSVRVTAITPRGFTELEKNLIKACEEAVRQKGYAASDTPDVELYVAVAEIPGEQGLLALSLVVVSKPVEKLVAFAGENELFYLAIGAPREKIPAEGTEVRRQLSEEYMRQFGQVEDQRVFIVRRSHLAEETADAVGGVLLNRTFLR
jgi:hypothetical protein